VRSATWGTPACCVGCATSSKGGSTMADADVLAARRAREVREQASYGKARPSRRTIFSPRVW
jgi:hypothetical protein